MDPEILFRIVDLTGVIANGVIGSALARAMGFDLVGFLALGTASGLGGGMLRDMLLGTGFPVALSDPWYLGCAFIAAAVAYVIPFEGRWTKRGLVLADVLALGCWSATGASKALSAGLGWIPSIFLGVVTAVMGGIIRDVMINRIPSIFGGSPLYATISILGASQMIFFQSNGMYEVGMGSSIVICAIFGLAARRYNWMLPKPLNIQVARYDLRKLKQYQEIKNRVRKNRWNQMKRADIAQAKKKERESADDEEGRR